MLRLKIGALTGRQWLTIATIAAAAIGFAFVVMTSLDRLLTTPTPVVTGDAPAAPAAPPPAAAPAVPRIKAILYFASEDGQRLVPTEQEVPLADGVVGAAIPTCDGFNLVYYYGVDSAVGLARLRGKNQ